MTLVLVRKLLRDVRWALFVVCLLLCLFSVIWVIIAQRVTTEISPFFEVISKAGAIDPKLMEEIVFKGPGKVSQAVLGGADIRFERPSDFLAVEMLHPVVIILTGLWAVGRAASAISGEIDRGTMELLLSQPVPRNRLIYAHLIVDAIVIPTIALSIVGGTQIGMAIAGPFKVNKDMFNKLPEPARTMAFRMDIPDELPAKAHGQFPASINLMALMFAVSGMTMLISACGRNRWRALGWSALIVLVMFIMNVIGQLWSDVGFLRPFSLFYYYQPQKVWLNESWTADLGDSWNGGKPLFVVPTVGILIMIGATCYGLALRIFTRRDLPAPL